MPRGTPIFGLFSMATPLIGKSIAETRAPEAAADEMFVPSCCDEIMNRFDWAAVPKMAIPWYVTTDTMVIHVRNGDRIRKIAEAPPSGLILTESIRGRVFHLLEGEKMGLVSTSSLGAGADYVEE
jgi:hypothetical protein